MKSGKPLLNTRTLSVRFLLFLSSVFATGQVADAQWRDLRTKLSEKLELETIRVFYDRTGEHAVPDADENKNQVPDFVENVARQILVAKGVFVDALGFPDPLASDRYRRAKFIDVNLLSRKSLKLNGVAYDGLQRFRRTGDPENLRTLCIDIATSIDPTRNPTPAHEYFHLIQNGATFFKTRWYTEGMARWAEHALQSGGLGKIKYKGPWPMSKLDQKKLFKLTYDAEFYLWNPLAKASTNELKFSRELVGSQLRSLRYVNGKTILKDYQLRGAPLMRDILKRLAAVDDLAKKELGYESWSEKNQKSTKNSKYILKAVMDVFDEHLEAAKSKRSKTISK